MVPGRKRPVDAREVGQRPGHERSGGSTCSTGSRRPVLRAFPRARIVHIGRAETSRGARLDRRTLRSRRRDGAAGSRCPMSEIAYEIVDSADQAVVGLYRAGKWWREDPAQRAVIPAMIRGSFCFLVARDPEGRIVGMGRVISDGVSDAYIQDVVVLEAWRGRGIGREIVRRLTERCPRSADRLDRPGRRARDESVLPAVGVPRPRGLRADAPRRRARWPLRSSA